MAVGDRVDQFRALAQGAARDLFDQSEPFGRLALVQVLMIGGVTLVTISLAGSLFFSISPHAAEHKVLLYLLLTLAPFAIVSPLLGPLIDKSRGARRAMVVIAAVGQGVLCPFMATDLHSLLLFPEAFCILVFSKLYLVTRGALVPEMVAIGLLSAPGPEARGAPAQPTTTEGEPDAAHTVHSTAEYAALNARLTLLGTVAGFVLSIPGVFLLKVVGGAAAVLILATAVFAAAAVAGARLPVPSRPKGDRAAEPERPGTDEVPSATVATEEWAHQRDLVTLQPVAHHEVLVGLSTMAVVRGLGGFLIFLLAFGLKREHAGLEWYGAALALSGIGSICGLLLVAPIRRFLIEQSMLLGSVWLIAAGAAFAAYGGGLWAQVFLATVVGFAGAIAQPSFTAIAQHFVPLPAQGRAFARFAMRQQLVWVLGALLAVVIPFTFRQGDVVMAVAGAVTGVFYLVARRTGRNRALPRSHTPPTQ